MAKIIRVVNITDEDNEGLGRVASLGYVGWNNRSVYAKGKGWLLYFNLEGCELVIGIGYEVEFNHTEIPVVLSLIIVTTIMTKTKIMSETTSTLFTITITLLNTTKTIAIEYTRMIILEPLSFRLSNGCCTICSTHEGPT